MAESTRLRLRVAPGARDDGVVGRHGHGWKVRVSAPAQDGRANDAVVRLLCAELALPRAGVRLVSAERASADMKEQARKEVDLIVTDAHAEARAVTRRAAAEVERLRTRSEQIRLLLHGALDHLDGDEEAAEAA